MTGQNKKQQSKAGRKKKTIDKVKLKEIMILNPTRAEIAAFFDMKVDTLLRIENDDSEVTDIIETGYNKAKISLRRLQWDAAHKGKVPMLIWLGKQWLGQTDRQEVHNTDEKPRLTNDQLKNIAKAVLNETD